MLDMSTLRAWTKYYNPFRALVRHTFCYDVGGTSVTALINE